MDPLSVASAAVSFLAFAGLSAEGLQRIIRDARNAPTEIIAIANELSDLNITVSAIESTCRDLPVSPDELPESIQNALKEIAARLERARAIIKRLETLKQEIYVSKQDGAAPKIQRTLWVRKKPEVLRLLDEVQGIKSTLHVLINCMNFSGIFKVRCGVQGISFSSVSVATAESSNGSIAPSHHNDNAALQIQMPEFNPDDDRQTDRLLQMMRQAGQFGSLTIQLHRTVRCGGGCLCRCHNRTVISTSSRLTKFVGNLFVGYAGMPLWTKKCDISTCFNHYSHAMQISYTFPPWFWMKAIDIVFAMTQTNEPCFAIKLRNRISEFGENNIFQFARAGDTAGIKKLFEQHKASPNILTMNGGFTPIHFAIELGQIETIKFLIDAGVDVFLPQDGGGSDAFEMSGLAVVPKTRSPHATVGFRSIIEQKLKASIAEIWGFSFLHRVIVKELHVDLEEVLRDPIHQENVDVRDIRNRTPLHWAALRGDHEAVKLLIQAGADPEAYDNYPSSCFEAAIQSGNWQCVEYFRIGRVDLRNWRDMNHQQTALQIASWAFDDPSFLEAIVLAGVEVNAGNCFNEGPLHSAACLNHVRNGEYLISVGADLEKKDAQGHTPLLEAVFYGNAEMMKVLLDHGANVATVNKHGQDVSHIAAIYGTVECVDILASHSLHGLRLDTPDKDGRTPCAAFEERVPKSAELERAMAAFFAAISQTDREEEIFYDAME